MLRGPRTRPLRNPTDKHMNMTHRIGQILRLHFSILFYLHLFECLDLQHFQSKLNPAVILWQCFYIAQSMTSKRI